MNNTACCFIGHREVKDAEVIKERVKHIICALISNEGIDTFLFGSVGEFNRLCLEAVTEIKEEHPHIKRVYVRAEFPYINDSYKKYLLQSYDDTYFPEKIINAGSAVYVERNRIMIEESHYCVTYFNENETKKKSGTRLACEFAKKHKKKIINAFY